MVIIMGIYYNTFIFQGKIINYKEKTELENKGTPSDRFRILDTKSPGKYAYIERLVNIPPEATSCTSWKQIKILLENNKISKKKFGSTSPVPEISLLQEWNNQKEVGDGLVENGVNIGEIYIVRTMFLSFDFSTRLEYLLKLT